MHSFAIGKNVAKLHYTKCSGKPLATKGKLFRVERSAGKAFSDCLYRGSYMSVHVLLNLLNELGKKIRCEAIYHMPLNSHFISKFCTKTSRFAIRRNLHI